MNATALHAIIFDRVFGHVSQCVYICVLLDGVNIGQTAKVALDPHLNQIGLESLSRNTS